MKSSYRQKRQASSLSPWILLFVTACVMGASAAHGRPPLGFVTHYRQRRNQKLNLIPGRIDESKPYIRHRSYLLLSRPGAECIKDKTSVPVLMQKDVIHTEDISTDLDGSETIAQERTLGILILLTVPLAWGTYTPGESQSLCM
jgi:hypothetical protein